MSATVAGAVRPGLFSAVPVGYHGRMRIACPSCGAQYEVPAAKLAPGRNVRCVKCGSLWAPVAAPEPEPAVVEAAPAAVEEKVVETPPPPIEEVAMPEPEEPVSEPVALSPAGTDEVPEAAPPEPQPAVGRNPRVAAAWVGTLVVLVALVAAAIVFRDRIMAAWPPSTRAYAWLGLGG